jgi:hypothetical protein
MTYYNGNPYMPESETNPLDRFAHDGCLPESEFELLPINGVPTVRMQRAPWSWSPVWGAPEPCAYCGRPVK